MIIIIIIKFCYNATFFVKEIIFHRLSIKQLLFLSCRLFVVVTTLSTSLVGVEVTSEI